MTINPPRCVDLEQTLLAACMAGECSPICDPEDFSTELHQKIASAMRKIEFDNGKPDLVTVADRVQGVGITPVEIAGIAQFAASGENIEHYSRVVQEYATARRMQIRAWNFVQELGERKKPISQIVTEFGADILRTSDTSVSGRELGMKEAVKRFSVDLDDRMSRGSAIIGLSTGIRKLDYSTSGLCPGNYMIIAARPSIGKTALALQIVRFIAAQNKRVLIESLDMSNQELVQRMVCNDSGVNLSSIRSGNVRPNEYASVAQSTTRLYELPIIFSDTPANDIEIVRKCRKVQPDLLVIDHFTKIQRSKKSNSMHADFSDISKVIKNLAKDMQIPVILLAQLNRLMERENREPRDSDLRETGSLEEDADIILFLHAQNGDKKQPTRDFFLSKQRQGECGIRWTMEFDGAHQKFSDLHEHQPHWQEGD